MKLKMNRIRKRRRQGGSTLIETMVATALMLVVSGGVMVLAAASLATMSLVSRSFRSRDWCGSITRRAGAQPKQLGFSTLELTFVMALSLVVMAMSVIQMQPFLQQTQANSAQQQLKESLRQARELAISQRRTMVVQFSGTKTTTLYQVAEPSNVMSTTPYLKLVLPGAAQFMTLTGETDTPDGFGKPLSGGIEFGGSSGTPTSGVQFQSDGTFTDGNGNPINGTIFLGLPNVLTSARAITILGNTGRIKVYQYTGTSWVQ